MGKKKAPKSPEQIAEEEANFPVHRCCTGGEGKGGGQLVKIAAEADDR